LTPLLVGLLLFVVLCGRTVSVQLDVDAAAHDAARAASIARTIPAATTGARDAALATLTARTQDCPTPSITVNTGGLRPGGVVTVSVTCQVPLRDLALLGVPGTRTVSSTASSPIDVFRGISLGGSS
jgi:Flp pilus assembly protein TadG